MDGSPPGFLVLHCLPDLLKLMSIELILSNFSIVNEAEVNAFLEFPSFFYADGIAPI